MVQAPVVLRVTAAEETLFAIDWLPIVQDPDAAKLTCSPFGAPPDMAVAVTVGVLPRGTELGKAPRVMVWSFLSTAGTEGGLWRCAPPVVSGTRVVDIV